MIFDVAAVGSFAILVPDQSRGVLVYDLAEALSERNPATHAIWTGLKSGDKADLISSSSLLPCKLLLTDTFRHLT